MPPPSHALSLQALWLLHDFDYFNGATYVVPRSQQRAEHVDEWRRNGSASALAAGLFPVRFVTGRAGDVALAFGSLWHSSSSAHQTRRDAARAPAAWPASARLALLFEYATSFVKPLHRYAPELLRRSVPQRHWQLFPQVDNYGGAWGPLRDGGRATAPSGADATCEPTDDTVSVHEWPKLLRERPHCVHARTNVVLRGGGPHMPIFGLGTGGPDDDEAVIAAALRAGYRLLDMGELYENEEVVGRALRRSGLHRDTVFVSSKAGRWCTSEPPAELLAELPPHYRGLRGVYATSRGTLSRAVCVGGAQQTRDALLASLRRLGLTHLDLYLLHWPLSSAAYALDDGAHAAVRLEAWQALVELKREGKVRPPAWHATRTHGRRLWAAPRPRGRLACPSLTCAGTCHRCLQLLASADRAAAAHRDARRAAARAPSAPSAARGARRTRSALHHHPVATVADAVRPTLRPIGPPGAAPSTGAQILPGARHLAAGLQRSLQARYSRSPRADSAHARHATR